jgi:hypothetical protein
LDRLGQALTHRQRWRRCQDLLQGIQLPSPFDVEAFCRDIGARRGRPIRVLSQPTGSDDGGPCGVWVATATEDVIFVEPNVTSLHREHIVLHEVGHMLCEHEPQTALPGALASDVAVRLMPHLDPALVRRVLGRTSYTTPQEEEAEVFATMVGSRITTRRPTGPQPPSSGDGVAVVLTRLSRVLGSPE